MIEVEGLIKSQDAKDLADGKEQYKADKEKKSVMAEKADDELKDMHLQEQLMRELVGCPLGREVC